MSYEIIWFYNLNIFAHIYHCLSFKYGSRLPDHTHECALKTSYQSLLSFDKNDVCALPFCFKRSQLVLYQLMICIPKEKWVILVAPLLTCRLISHSFLFYCRRGILFSTLGGNKIERINMFFVKRCAQVSSLTRFISIYPRSLQFVSNGCP